MPLSKYVCTVCSIRIRSDLHFEEQEERDRQRERVCVCVRACICALKHLILLVSKTHAACV